MSENIRESDWVLAYDYLPPINMLVKVQLENGVERVDFVNEPLDKKCPFQNYIVAKWRKLTREELNDILKSIRG